MTDETGKPELYQCGICDRLDRWDSCDALTSYFILRMGPVLFVGSVSYFYEWTNIYHNILRDNRDIREDTDIISALK